MANGLFSINDFIPCCTSGMRVKDCSSCKGQPRRVHSCKKCSGAGYTWYQCPTCAPIVANVPVSNDPSTSNGQRSFDGGPGTDGDGGGGGNHAGVKS